MNALLLALSPLPFGLILLLAGRRLDPFALWLALPLQLAGAVGAGGLFVAQGPWTVPWLTAPGGVLTLSLDAHGIGAPFAFLAAAIALPILVFARGQMGGQAGSARFAGLMLLFTGTMAWVALAANLLTLLLGWELLGLCSFGLIGFRYTEAAPNAAALRAFLTTRAADLGLYVAAMAAYAVDGGSFQQLADLPEGTRAVAAGGLIVAAAGKSAQLPFSGWLSGAMLGPTPASALIHSATLVAAGALLLLKTGGLLAAVPWAAPAVLWIGLATALAGGLIALYQNDLKQLLAASTCSQMGYVFAALGAGSAGAATAHLINHAAYKSLLFLAAGVLLARGLRRLDEMGGLMHRMPAVAALFGAGNLALAAVPPLGGFFSKQALYAAVHGAGGRPGWVLLAATLVTAAYAGRAWFAAFAGEPHGDPARRARDPGPLQHWPMAVLAAATVVLGLLVLPPFSVDFSLLLGAAPLVRTAWQEVLVSLVAVAAGLGWAYAMFRVDALVAESPAGREGRWTLDWFGLTGLLDGAGRLTLACGRVLARLDGTLGGSAAVRIVRALAGLVGAAEAGRLAGRVPGGAALAQGAGALACEGDGRLFDRAAGGLAALLRHAAVGLNGLQSGRVWGYYASLLGGCVLLLAAGWWTVAGVAS